MGSIFNNCNKEQVLTVLVLLTMTSLANSDVIQDIDDDVTPWMSKYSLMMRETQQNVSMRVRQDRDAESFSCYKCEAEEKQLCAADFSEEEKCTGTIVTCQQKTKKWACGEAPDTCDAGTKTCCAITLCNRAPPAPPAPLVNKRTPDGASSGAGFSCYTCSVKYGNKCEVDFTDQTTCGKDVNTCQQEKVGEWKCGAAKAVCKNNDKHCCKTTLCNRKRPKGSGKETNDKGKPGGRKDANIPGNEGEIATVHACALTPSVVVLVAVVVAGFLT